MHARVGIAAQNRDAGWPLSHPYANVEECGRASPIIFFLPIYFFFHASQVQICLIVFVEVVYFCSYCYDIELGT